MWIFKVVNESRVYRRCLNSFNNVFSRSLSDCYYDVSGSKDVSRYDSVEEFDISLDKKKIGLVDFFKSPEYQMIKVSTPTPSSILETFYDYSPHWKPIGKEGIGKYNIERWSLLQLDGFYKLTDYLWYLGMNGLLNRSDIERLSYNFSISVIYLYI